MLSAGLAVLLSTAPALALADDPDLRCVAAISVALGSVSTDTREDKSAQKPVDAEGIASLTAVFMYFVGKVDARRPGLDYAASMKRLFAQPGYSLELPADLARCGGEAQERGAMLEQLGKALEGIGPIAPSQAG